MTRLCAWLFFAGVLGSVLVARSAVGDGLNNPKSGGNGNVVGDGEGINNLGIGGSGGGGGNANCILISGTTTNCLLISGTTTNALLVK